MEPSKRQRDQDSINTGNKYTGLNLCGATASWQKILLFIPAIFFLFLLFSCAPGACFEETNAFLKVTFYKSATGKKVAPDSLTLYGLNMETNKIYNKTANVQPALLPLNANTSNCTFIIKINGKTDTMFVPYSSFPHLISKECGYSFYHTLDTPIVTNHAIISFKFANRNITTINEENLRIYY
jgi:hypothetical protein